MHEEKSSEVCKATFGDFCFWGAEVKKIVEIN